jgi:invasion protein IalB
MANSKIGNGILHQRLMPIYVAASIIAFLLSAPAMAQSPHGNIHGAWGVRCNTATGAPAACQIYQNIVVTESRKPILHFAIGFTEDAKTAVGIFVVPLGIYLPPGVTLQVDDGQIYELPIDMCAEKGCRVRFSFDDNLLNIFRRGETAKITFAGGDRKPIVIPVSLKGFTAALKDLKLP